MDYELCAKSNPTAILAHAAFDDDYAAEKWARQWATADARTDDYLIERADGGLSSHLFRTVGDQWFIMRR